MENKRLVFVQIKNPTNYNQRLLYGKNSFVVEITFKTVPIDLSKLSNVVHNVVDVVNKTVYYK